MLVSSLAYNYQKQGHHLVKSNQWLPSSKTCSSCGALKSHMDLKQREYHCDQFGTTQHRHINAAVNIRNWEHQLWTLDHAGQELPPAPVDVVTDILTHCGLLSATTIKQESTAL